jgi:hypothetical protein
MLNLGWSDGQTFIPVDFRLLASGNDKNLLEGSHVKEDKRTIATKRRTDARRDKPSLVLDMLKAVKGTPAQAKYVLFDSWFASPSSLLSIKGLGFDVTARMKNTEKYHFLYDGTAMPLRKVYSMCKKRRGRSRYLLSVIAHIRHKDFDDTIPAKFVFVRDKNNRKNWIALVSTDTSLSEEEIITLYGKRWDIEPFHKMLKSFLRLGSEFQLRSFDAVVAHTAVVLARYTFLALENRENKDDRTLGALFFFVCDELNDISFNDAFQLIISTLSQCLGDFLALASQRVEAFVIQFINHLPVWLMDKMAVAVCES